MEIEGPERTWRRGQRGRTKTIERVNEGEKEGSEGRQQALEVISHTTCLQRPRGGGEGEEGKGLRREE